jgi:hypothetical protein
MIWPVEGVSLERRSCGGRHGCRRLSSEVVCRGLSSVVVVIGYLLLPSQLRSSSSTSNSDLPSVFRPSDVIRTSATRLFSSLALIS